MTEEVYLLSSSLFARLVHVSDTLLIHKFKCIMNEILCSQPMHKLLLYVGSSLVSIPENKSA